MENVYIDLGDDMTIGDGSSMVIGEDNLYTESETMVGPQGPPGPPGPAGFSPVATVTQNAGSATITITDATTTSSATVYDGQDGTDGAAATITVGSTTTGEPGTQASVTNSGTSSAAVLDFVIPKGAKGDQGEQGDAATVDVGTIVAIAPDDTPQVTNSGTVHDAILNFAIPQGYDGFSPVATVTQNTGSATISITDENGTTTATVYDGQDGAPGQTGPAGQDGQAATITVGSTTTGNAGTNASVTNSGTSSAAVLDFVIPRGADGQNGTDGNDGADGFSPIATVTQNTGSATISITDANGTTTATVYDGTPGTVPNDGTLTIQQNGTAVQTFTANQSTNATANILVPTAVSELSNDLNFLMTVTTSDIVSKAVTADKLDHVILWSGTDSGSGNIPLSQSISTLRYVEIFFHDDQDFRNSIKIFTDYSSGTVKSCIQNIKTGVNGNAEFIVAKRIELSGTTLTRGLECTSTLNTSGVSITASSNYLRFDRIIGYES